MQVLSPRAIYKVNCKLFSHSKLPYSALGHAEKMTGRIIWENKGYLLNQTVLRGKQFWKLLIFNVPGKTEHKKKGKAMEV